MNEFEFAWLAILFIWSAVLVWATCSLARINRALDRERQALARWTRIRKVAERQNVKWQ